MTIPKLEVEDKREHEGRRENHETNWKTIIDALWLVFIYLRTTRRETPFYIWQCQGMNYASNLSQTYN